MKICLIGTGPWPLEEGAVITGPGIRTRQFLEPLHAARHEIVCVLLEPERRHRVPIEGALQAEAFPPEDILDPERLVAELDLSFTDVVMGVGSLMPAAAAARLARHRGVPCWIDFFGDPLAELHAAQLRQGGRPDVAVRDHIWKLTREALLAGDAFSTVSGPQRHALLGQLGLLGRFGSHWPVCQHLHEVPCGVPDSWTDPAPLPEFPLILRDKGFTEKMRYVFFGGSWNVWLDEETMAKALRQAMEEAADLHFVCCGIPTGPAGEQVRANLMRGLGDLVSSGRVVEIAPRHLEEESALLAWAGACLSLDRPIPEAELGSRNRLLAMVRWGARPVVSLEAGLETVLVAEGLAAGIMEGNWQRAGKEILAGCARSRENREEDRRAGMEWLRTVTFSRTLEPVVQWLARGAPEWPPVEVEGLVDRWAHLPPDPGLLFQERKKKSFWAFWPSRGERDDGGET